MSDRAARFPTTCWTAIRQAQQDPACRERALAELLPRYWTPLYCYLRRKGLDADAAGDAVQGLCVRLLERGFVERLDPGRGSLRAFLKASADRYLVDAYWRGQARKRGGGLHFLAFDPAKHEALLCTAPDDADTAYEREWALGIFERALAALHAEFTSGRRRGDFAIVERFFHPTDVPSYASAAAACGCTPQQFKASLHRARARFRQFVRRELQNEGGDDPHAFARLFASLSA